MIFAFVVDVLELLVECFFFKIRVVEKSEVDGDDREGMR